MESFCISYFAHKIKIFEASDSSPYLVPFGLLSTKYLSKVGYCAYKHNSLGAWPWIFEILEFYTIRLRIIISHLILRAILLIFSFQNEVYQDQLSFCKILCLRKFQCSLPALAVIFLNWLMWWTIFQQCYFQWPSWNSNLLVFQITLETCQTPYAWVS